MRPQPQPTRPARRCRAQRMGGSNACTLIAPAEPWFCSLSRFFRRFPNDLRSRAGGHLIGRFWFGSSPTAGWPKGNPGCTQVTGGSLAPDPRSCLDAPQAPAQPPQRDDLLFLLFVQDIAHLTEPNRPVRNNVPTAISVGRFSGVHQWPVLSVHRGVAWRDGSLAFVRPLLLACGTRGDESRTFRFDGVWVWLG